MSAKLCFIDVETTGLDPKAHAIYQMAGIIVDRDMKGNGVEFNYKIKPHDMALIDPQALLVGGVEREAFATYEAPAKVLQDFTRLLDRVVDKFDKTDKLFFVGYNATFDDAFLRSFFTRLGHKFYGSYFWWPPIDVAVLAAILLANKRHTLPDFKLGTVYKEIMGKDLVLAHDAMQDIRGTRDIFDYIMMEIST